MEDFARLKKAWGTADDFQKEGIITEMENLCVPEAEEFIRGVLSSQKEYYHVRGWAARALRRTAEPKSIAALAYRLEWDINPFVKSMCADSIAKNAEFINTLEGAVREKIITVLREAAASDDFDVRRKAVLALAGFRDEKSLDAMVDAVGKLQMQEGVTDYEEISLALCEMGRVELASVLAFAKTMEHSLSLELAEKMMKATGELLRKRHMDETWRGRLMGAMRVCKNKLAANRRPPGESFVDNKLGIRFARPSIAEPITPGSPSKKAK